MSDSKAFNKSHLSRYLIHFMLRHTGCSAHTINPPTHTHTSPAYRGGTDGSVCIRGYLLCDEEHKWKMDWRHMEYYREVGEQQCDTFYYFISVKTAIHLWNADIWFRGLPLMWVEVDGNSGSNNSVSIIAAWSTCRKTTIVKAMSVNVNGCVMAPHLDVPLQMGTQFEDTLNYYLCHEYII